MLLVVDSILQWRVVTCNSGLRFGFNYGGDVIVPAFFHFTSAFSTCLARKLSKTINKWFSNTLIENPLNFRGHVAQPGSLYIPRRRVLRFKAWVWGCHLARNFNTKSFNIIFIGGSHSVGFPVLDDIPWIAVWLSSGRSHYDMVRYCWPCTHGTCDIFLQYWVCAPNDYLPLGLWFLSQRN